MEESRILVFCAASNMTVGNTPLKKIACHQVTWVWSIKSSAKALFRKENPQDALGDIKVLT